MNIRVKFFIVFVLICLSVLAAYSQDCNSYLIQATELRSQEKYCEAKKYYQMYQYCNADANVSTEIAMCEKRFQIQNPGVECPNYVPDYDTDKKKNTSSQGQDTSSDSRKVKPVSNVITQGLSGFQLHGGVFLPQGKDNNMAIGYNLGFKVYKPISSVSGLSLVFGADAFYNGMKSEDKDSLIKDIEAEVENAGGEKYKYTLPFCLNIPITAGINYAYAITDKFSIYGEAAAGYNFSKQNGFSLRFSTPGGDYSYNEKIDIATGFTYGLEAGVLLNNKITIGIRYNDFGSYKYEGKAVEEYAGYREEYDFKADKLTINGISITLGILF